MINIIQEEALKCGLMLNHSKCKALAQNVNTDMPLKVNGKEIEYVSTFNYLGSFISSNGNITPEVNNRISKATKAFGMLKTLWSSRDVSRSIKLRFYKAGIRSTLLFACETWHSSLATTLDSMHLKNAVYAEFCETNTHLVKMSSKSAK